MNNEMTTNTTDDRSWATPPVDIFEGEKEYLLALDLPGVAKTDLSVQIEDGKLSIDATRGANGSTVAYRRVFTLAPNVDEAEMSAELANGVLTVHIPKAAKQTLSIPVSVA